VGVAAGWLLQAEMSSARAANTVIKVRIFFFIRNLLIIVM
jgi:hypothetical protein